MKDPRDEIDPNSIPTLTEVIKPGQSRQLSLDDLMSEVPPVPEEDTASEENAPEPVDMDELYAWATDGENLTDASLEAFEPEHTFGTPEERDISADIAPVAEHHPNFDPEELEPMISAILERHMAAAREEILETLQDYLLAQRSDRQDG